MVHFSIMDGSNVLTQFEVSSKLFQEGLGKGSEESFEALCAQQGHPCESCGATAVIKFFLEDIDHEDCDWYEGYVKAIMHMAKRVGVEVNKKTRFVTLDIKKLAIAYSIWISNEGSEEDETDVEFDDTEFDDTDEFIFRIKTNICIGLRIEKYDFRNSHAALMYLKGYLETECLHCVAQFILDKIFSYSEEQIGKDYSEFSNDIWYLDCMTDGVDDDFITTLLLAAYQIHVDLNVYFEDEYYPEGNDVIDLVELVTNADMKMEEVKPSDRTTADVCFVIGDSVMVMDLEIYNVCKSHSAVREVMRKLGTECMHCVVEYVFDRIDDYHSDFAEMNGKRTKVKDLYSLGWPDNEEQANFLRVLLLAAYNIHIDLNEFFYDEPYPENWEIISLADLVERAEARMAQ